jgi:RHH-type rel operon transcriptional repressor/antitoxin RelB
MYYIMYYKEAIMISLRLDTKTEKEIETTAASAGMSKSDLIRKSVQEYLKLRSTSPWDRGRDLFARHGSGIKNLSENVAAVFREKIRKKSR